MGKNKVLVKVNPEGKYVVDLGEHLPAAPSFPLHACVYGAWCSPAGLLVAAAMLAELLRLAVVRTGRTTAGCSRMDGCCLHAAGRGHPDCCVMWLPPADKEIDIGKVTPGARVALRNDSYTLHVLLPTKVRWID